MSTYFLDREAMAWKWISLLNNNWTLTIGTELWSTSGLFPLPHTAILYRSSLKRLQCADRRVFLCLVLFSHQLVTRTEYTASEKNVILLVWVDAAVQTASQCFCIMKEKNTLSREVSGKMKGKQKQWAAGRRGNVQGGNGKIKAVGFRLQQWEH